jgi:hypothetical protein
VLELTRLGVCVDCTLLENRHQLTHLNRIANAIEDVVPILERLAGVVEKSLPLLADLCGRWEVGK